VYKTLYRDWGVAREPEEHWYNPQQGGRFIVAGAADGTPLGVCRLMSPEPDDPDRAQIRQVTVNPESRGIGLGRLLMEKAEELAALEGISELWLNAREAAEPFYEKLRYRYTSDVWLSELTGIPHCTMSKFLEC